MSENQVRFWLTRFRKLDPNVKSHRETLINTFVNAVYLYDEKVLITFNYKDGTKPSLSMKLPPKMPQRAMVRIWVASLHQNSSVVKMLEFFFCPKLFKAYPRVDSNSCGAVAEDSAKQPSGLFLAARLA